MDFKWDTSLKIKKYAHAKDTNILNFADNSTNTKKNAACQLSRATCHVLRVSCHLTPVTSNNSNSHIPSPYKLPHLHSKLVQQDGTLKKNNKKNLKIF